MKQKAAFGRPFCLHQDRARISSFDAVDGIVDKQRNAGILR
jgi:hypothetical protein